MFKNRRSVQFQVVKTPKAPPPPPQPAREPLDPMVIHAMAREDIRYIAMLIGIGYGMKRVFDLGSEIAVLAAKTNIK